MEELELSVMMLDIDPSDELRPLLAQFEARHKCHVRVSALPWASGWADLVKTALHGVGPDVSAIGTTWCASFVAMNALRPFAPREVAALGGESAFLPSAWQMGILPDDNRMWAVPWLADLRVIYYRRDLLEQAGIDEQTAFTSHPQLLRTLEYLQASGVTVPWVMPTNDQPTLHNLATWVWAAGGDFITADGKRSLLNQPEARAGLHTYFELSRYLSPTIRDLDIFQSQDLFWQGQAAAMLSWPQRRLRNLQQSAVPRVAANLGAALTPGVTWSGGTELVIWQHSSHSSRVRETLILDLVCFLTSQSFQSAYGRRTDYLPVRYDVLDAPPFSTDPVYRTFAQGLKTGRTFPSIAAWGLVEDKIVRTLEQIWKEVMAGSLQDLDTIIAKHVDPLTQQLDHLLDQMR